VRGTDHDVRVVPSVLDRLIDREPKVSRDGEPTRTESVTSLKRAVQRDLDHLLNTRNPYADLPAAFAETSRSVLAYGLPDFTALNLSSPRSQARLRQLVEITIRTFEPRLAGVSVTLVPTDGTERSISLRVDARLVIDPAPEPIAFDIVMPLLTRSYEVRASE
jgi:type VI secretion system protein ImpF